MRSLYFFALVVAFASLNGVSASWRQAKERIPDVRSVEGRWYNSLGSELIISRQKRNGEFVGEFRTAKERYAGAAGEGASMVHGRISGNMLSFSVFWEGNDSVTTWTGHFFSEGCEDLEGEDSLRLTWTLVSSLPSHSCNQHWNSNRMGQDTFTREDSVPGPRRDSKARLD